jgi:hypothetical protein
MENDFVGAINFDTLCKSERLSARDKVLVSVVAALCDAGLAESLVSYLTTLPEPINPNKEFFGRVKASQVAGLSSEQARRVFALNENEYNEIVSYLGLDQQTQKAGA